MTRQALSVAIKISFIKQREEILKKYHFHRIPSFSLETVRQSTRPFFFDSVRKPTFKKTFPHELSDSYEWPSLIGVTLCHGYNAADGEHCQASIFEFFQPHFICLLGVLRQEVLSQKKVARFSLDIATPALEEKPQTVYFDCPNNSQHFAHVEGVFHKIIMRCHRGFYLLEHFSGKASAEVRRNPSNGGKHADATVLQFCLSHQVDRNRVCCAKGVETLFSTNPAVQLLWMQQEWH
mmetsp:Transcript_68168/g.131662  ORF Transcript_68168/g.131662 Transcript_68168/m.131662 type:complete len:236 (+) Transcript_68168:36-743(+)